MVNECIFCKIINGDIPSTTVFENNMFKVFLDAFPSSVGHTIIIPKIHTADIYEIEPELCGELFKLVPEIAKKLRKALDCDGINVLQNNGAASGQTVFHFHVHLIPRYANDEVSIKWNTTQPTGADIQKLLQNFA